MAPALQVAGATVVLGGHAALAGVDLERRAGRGGRRPRPERLRQVDPAAGGRRARTARRRVGRARRPRPRRRAAPPARLRPDVPGRALFPHATSPATSPSGCGCGARPRGGGAGSTELLELVGLGGASTGPSRRCRVASASGSRWPARSRPRRGCCCSTSRWARSTGRCTTGSSSELRRSSTEIHQTAVYVTHDVAEAFALGSRVAVMRAGKILQVASPDNSGPPRPTRGWRGSSGSRTSRNGRNLARDPAGGSRPPSRCRRERDRHRHATRWAGRHARARFDDGREIVSAHAGLPVPAPGHVSPFGRSARQ